MRNLKNDISAMVDLGLIIMIGVAFAALMVISFIIFEIKDQLIDSATSANVNSSIQNITEGWDAAVQLLLIAITIFILAIAISSLMLLRGR